MVMNSAPSKNIDTIRLFSSLYRAIEYAHHLSYGGDPFDKEEIRHIPSIWAVRYQGSVASLEFISEELIIHKGTSSYYQES